jgi:hypothetical protein
MGYNFIRLKLILANLGLDRPRGQRLRDTV